jgi:hypothetical protein
MRTNGFVFISLLILIALSFVFFMVFRSSNLSIDQSLDDKITIVVPSITITPTDVPDNAIPTVIRDTFTTPLMKHYTGSSYKISFVKLSTWEFGTYKFNVCEDLMAPCEYSLEIINILHPEYVLRFGHSDEFANCIYDLSKPDESGYSARIENYKTYKTGFGLIRIGNAENTNRLVVCQNNVSQLKDKTTDWVTVTEVESIGIHVPDNADQLLVNEMIQMITKIKLINVK